MHDVSKFILVNNKSIEPIVISFGSSIICRVEMVKGLVTNYREEGATKREGGTHVKFYPYEKGGGGGKSFRNAEGGGGAQKVLG